MLRRSLMAMFGGAAVAPAASKAAARAEAVTGRVAMGDMASLSAPMAYGRVVGISDPESRLGRPAGLLPRRSLFRLRPMSEGEVDREIRALET